MMNKEYIIKLAQLINEYPILLIKAWVDADSLSVCQSDDGLLVSNVRKDGGLEWEEAICVYLGG